MQSQASECVPEGRRTDEGSEVSLRSRPDMLSE